MKRVVLLSSLPVVALVSGGKYYVDEVTPVQARDAINRASMITKDYAVSRLAATIVSAVGHPATATQMSVDLLLDVECNRQEISDIRYPDIAIVAVPVRTRAKTKEEVTEIEHPVLRYFLITPAFSRREHFIGRYNEDGKAIH